MIGLYLSLEYIFFREKNGRFIKNVVPVLLVFKKYTKKVRKLQNSPPDQIKVENQVF